MAPSFLSCFKRRKRSTSVSKRNGPGSPSLSTDQGRSGPILRRRSTGELNPTLSASQEPESLSPTSPDHQPELHVTILEPSVGISLPPASHSDAPRFASTDLLPPYILTFPAVQPSKLYQHPRRCIRYHRPFTHQNSHHNRCMAQLKTTA